LKKSEADLSTFTTIDQVDSLIVAGQETSKEAFQVELKAFEAMFNEAQTNIKTEFDSKVDSLKSEVTKFGEKITALETASAENEPEKEI
jgi:hypothetical protein